MRIRLVCVLIIVVFAGVTSVFAAPAGSRKERSTQSGQPITIKSNELHADNKGRVAVFSGKVVAKQGNVTIFSDKMTVYYGAAQGDVDRIEADGNVRIVQENRTGMAAHALYDSREGKVTLTGGSPRVMQGVDSVAGEVITYFIDDERSSVSGGRVEATIHPKGKGDGAASRKNAEQR